MPRNQSKITTEYTVDDALIQDADFEFDEDDRQYLDNQIRGTQQRVVELKVAVDELDGGGGGGGGGVEDDDLEVLPTAGHVTTDSNTPVDTPIVTLANPQASRLDVVVTANNADYSVGATFGIRAYVKRTGESAVIVEQHTDPMPEATELAAVLAVSGGGAIKLRTTGLDGEFLTWAWEIRQQTTLPEAGDPEEPEEEIDIATVNLDVCVEDFGGSPWAGMTTAGSSASHDFVAGTSEGGDAGDLEPDVGTPVNGHAPVSFAGTTQLVDDGAWFVGDAISTAGFYIGVYFKARTVTSSAGAPTTVPSLYGDQGANLGLGFYKDSDTNVEYAVGYMYDATEETDTYANRVKVPCSSGAKHFAEMRFEGNKIYVSVDSGTESASPGTIDTTYIDTYLSTLLSTIGKGYNTFLDGDIYAVYASKTIPSTGTRAGLRSRAQSRFGT